MIYFFVVHRLGVNCSFIQVEEKMPLMLGKFYKIQHSCSLHYCLFWRQHDEMFDLN